MFIKITRRILDSLKSQNNGYDYKTLRYLGVPTPPIHGWQRKILGENISQYNLDRAIESARCHRQKIAERRAMSGKVSKPKKYRHYETYEEVEARIQKNWTTPIMHDQSLAPWESEKLERFVEAASKSIGLPEYFI